MGSLAQAMQMMARLMAALPLVVPLAPVLGAADSVTPQLVSSNDTVLLISGLPGDLESETAYRQTLTSWLEVLNGPSKPRKTYLLSDRQEELGSEILQRTASRTNLLALGRELAGSAESLLVVAWGHGGRQGSQTVFHVRGPRITPDDFKTFCSEIGAPKSKWVLVFRGSGAFGEAIAGDGKTIITSDSGRIYGSDPIAMTPILSYLRKDPNPTVNELSSGLGRGVAEWFKERSLARTEEPTLWADTSEPVLLVAQVATNLLEAEAPLVATDKKPESKPPALEKEATPSSSIPANWARIKPVDAREYPDADAVTLSRTTSYTIGSNPAISTETDEYIQVLTTEGKHYGDFDISYTPPHEDITFLACEVLPPGGKLEQLDPEAIRDAREESLGDYQSGHRKVFSLPGVGPGAILHIRYRSYWKTFPLPYVSMEVPLARDIPQLRHSVEISVPKQSKFHFSIENVKLPEPVIRQTGYGTTYSWSAANLPPFEREPLTSPGQTPRMLFSTFPDWEAFATWYSRLTRFSDEATPELVTKAKELTTTATTDREKVIALYNYVTSMRYVAVPLGVNSLRPHSAENVFRNQYGDCKDKANLFNTMLREIGIPAHLVLVPRFSQAYEKLPGFAFNHAISRVQLRDQTFWIDTTDDVCRFGMLPPGDPGRNVLVIDGKTTTLTRLPKCNLADHTLTLSGEIDLANTPGPSTVSLRAKAKGFPDYALRTVSQSVRNHWRALPLLAPEFQMLSGTFALQTQNSTPASALERDFEWEARGTLMGNVAVARNQTVVTAPFWLPNEWFLALHTRKSALFLNKGYPLLLTEVFRFRLPANLRIVDLPPSWKTESAPLRASITWEKEATDAVVKLNLELPDGELDTATTPEFRRQLEALVSTCANPLVLGPSTQPR